MQLTRDPIHTLAVGQKSSDAAEAPSSLDLLSGNTIFRTQAMCEASRPNEIAAIEAPKETAPLPRAGEAACSPHALLMMQQYLLQAASAPTESAAALPAPTAQGRLLHPELAVAGVQGMTLPSVPSLAMPAQLGPQSEAHNGGLSPPAAVSDHVAAVGAYWAARAGHQIAHVEEANGPSAPTDQAAQQLRHDVATFQGPAPPPANLAAAIDTVGLIGVCIEVLNCRMYTEGGFALKS